MDYFQKRQLVLEYVIEHRTIKRSVLIHALPKLLHVQLPDAKRLVDQLVMNKDLVHARLVDGRGNKLKRKGRPATRYVIRPALEELFEEIRRRKGIERFIRH